MNYVVYPVFFSGNEDRCRFTDLMAHGLGWAAGRHLAEKGRCQAIVVTDDPEVASRAAGEGLEVSCCNAGTDVSPSSLARGALAALWQMHKLSRSFLHEGDVVAVVDYRAPDVNKEQIDGILRKALNEPGVWVGLSEPEDHPIQFKVFFETLSAELHLYSDPQRSARVMARVSKAFPLELSGLAENERSGGFLRMPPASLGATFEPLSKEDALREASGRSLVVELTGNGMGRRVLSHDAPWPESAMLPFCGNLDEARILLLPMSDDLGTEIYTTPLSPGVYRLSLYPASAGNLQCYPSWESLIRVEAKADASITVAGRIFTGPLAHFPYIHGDGSLVVLECQSKQGHAERVVALQMAGSNWDVEEDIIRINRNSSCKVMGRQDFPQVWEFDGALLAVDVGSLSRLLTTDFLDGAHGYLLGPRTSAGRAVLLGLPLGRLAAD